MTDWADTAASPPEGWKLVPIEPTAAMLMKGHDAISRASYLGFDKSKLCYRLMLDAAPEPPEDE